MRCSKPFAGNLLILIFIGLFPITAQAAKMSMADCLEKGKQSFADQLFEQAKADFEQCVKMSPKDVEANLSLAGVLLTMDDLDGAEQTFKKALSEMKPSSPYFSYTYSMLGDIALKRQKNEEALEWYTKSLESNAANVNSLIGKGVIYEYQGSKQEAAGFYRSALAVEPLNLIARQRLINLEPVYFTDAEILAALKQRHAIEPTEEVLTDKMRQLFVDIHRAEQRRGVEYLKSKYPKVPARLVVTLDEDTDFERDLLTLAGYETLKKDLGQDAIAVFQKMGVPINEVFKLRNFKNEKVFNPDNTLTDTGLVVYTEALQNRKAFLRPNESLPPTKEFLQRIAQRAEEIKQQGYMEISSKELKFIEKQTKCSEQTLRSDMGLYILPVTKTSRRYFIINREVTGDPKKGAPYYYLMKERAKVDPSIKAPRNSLAESYAFYGYTLCADDGKLLQ